MCGDQLTTERVTGPEQNYYAPPYAKEYPVADSQEIAKFSKLFHQTGRMKCTDTYIWISPFVR